MNEPLSEAIRIRVTPSHAARLGEAAALSGLPLSNYILRRLVIEDTLQEELTLREVAQRLNLPYATVFKYRYDIGFRLPAWVTAAGAKSGYAGPVPLNEDATSGVTRRLPHEGKHIFTRPGMGGRISRMGARCFNRACHMTEITDFRFHDLRHTWAIWQTTHRRSRFGHSVQ